MIWFNCKQCGRKHSRPDGQAGAMIFCDCGQGLRVPWSSTIPEPEAGNDLIPLADEPAPAGPVPSARAVPVPTDDSAPRRPSIPVPPSPPSAAPPRRQKPYRKVNPGFCLNHDETASAHTCADCRLPFCAACVVSLKGVMLCGPCKNFRLRSQTRAARVSGLAIVGLVVGLASGPVAFCLSMMGVGAQIASEGSLALAIVFVVIGMLLPGAGIVLSGLALQTIDNRPNVGGRGLALTAFVTSLVGVLWNLTVGLLVILKQVQG
jgi:hypothetical protein